MFLFFFRDPPVSIFHLREVNHRYFFFESVNEYSLFREGLWLIFSRY